VKGRKLDPGSVADGLGHAGGGGLDGRRKAFPEAREGGLYGYDPYAGHPFKGGEEDRKGDAVGGEGRPFHVPEPEKSDLPRFTAAIGRIDDEEVFRGVLPEGGEVVLREDAAEEDPYPRQRPSLDHLGGPDAGGVVSPEFISDTPYKGEPFYGPSSFRGYPATKAGVLT